jgi:hypothetical protein
MQTADRQNRIMKEQLPPNAPNYVTVAETLDVEDHVNLCDSTLGAFAITLPPVGEAKGCMYSFLLQVDGGNVTIQDQNESQSWTDLVMTAVSDRALVYSDGFMWHTLDSVLT